MYFVVLKLMKQNIYKTANQKQNLLLYQIG